MQFIIVQKEKIKVGLFSLGQYHSTNFKYWVKGMTLCYKIKVWFIFADVAKFLNLKIGMI